jgi:hypothetical protein
MTQQNHRLISIKLLYRLFFDIALCASPLVIPIFKRIDGVGRAGSKVKDVDAWWVVVSIVRFMVSLLRHRLADC